MNNKHTPGPWAIGDEHPETGLLRVLSRKDYVCVLLPNPDDEASPEENCEQAKANARLIAAAPELLALLQRAHPHVCGETLFNEIWAAIKKAKGEE